MGMIKPALQINTLLLQTHAQPVRVQARRAADGGLPLKAMFQEQQNLPEGLDASQDLGFWPGSSLATAASPPGLISLAARAGISCFQRLCYADASRAPAIRNFIRLL